MRLSWEGGLTVGPTAPAVVTGCVRDVEPLKAALPQSLSAQYVRDKGKFGKC